MRSSRSTLVALALGLALSAEASPATVPVRHREGVVHGFLAVSDTAGKTIAQGEQTQTLEGDRVTSRLVLRFTDGSVSEETTVFTQKSELQLIRYQQVQKGPTFERPVELSVDVPGGLVTVRHRDGGGKEQTERRTMDLPADLANGMPVYLLKNLRPGESLTVPIVAATPAPRIIHLVMSPAGEERATLGGLETKLLRYRAKIEIGGVLGFFASLLGKVPPDAHVFILPGNAPTYVKSEAPLWLGGPPLLTRLVGPTWTPGARTGK